VDRNHNVPGHRVVDPDEARASRERDLMDQAPYFLNASIRGPVLDAIQEVCSHRQWTLLAAHVRANHVHTVVEADAKPKGDFSTRWLWNRNNVGAAIRYVIEEQGEPMAVFVAGA
jgi:hypothetical protein